jgi:hypothetical protein
MHKIGINMKPIAAVRWEVLDTGDNPVKGNRSILLHIFANFLLESVIRNFPIDAFPLAETISDFFAKDAGLYAHGAKRKNSNTNVSIAISAAETGKTRNFGSAERIVKPFDSESSLKW